MKLTERQRFLLWRMAEGDECVEDGRSVRVGEERTNVATLLFFLRNNLIKQMTPDRGCPRHYKAGPWALLALSNSAFDPWAELRLDGTPVAAKVKG